MKFSIVELAIVGLLLAFIGDAMQINWKSPQILPDHLSRESPARGGTQAVACGGRDVAGNLEDAG